MTSSRILRATKPFVDPVISKNIMGRATDPDTFSKWP